MSQPSQNSKRDKKTKDGEAATDLPDDDAIRKLFPKKVVDEVNKEIEHEPNSGSSEPSSKG